MEKTTVREKGKETDFDRPLAKNAFRNSAIKQAAGTCVPCATIHFGNPAWKGPNWRCSKSATRSSGPKPNYSIEPDGTL